jgi:hypothetical protein
MRNLLALALLLTGWLGSPLFLSAGDREDALAIIDRAIKAHGGEEALTKAQNAVRKGSGIQGSGGQEAPFTDVITMNLPNKLRLNIEIGKGNTVVLVYNGEQGWQRSGGAVTEMGRDFRDEIREEAYILWLTTLAPLKKEGFDLAPVAEIKVDGKPAEGVKVSRKSYRQVRLYFDKGTGMLVKISGAGRVSGVVVEKEYLYSAYKDFDGARLFTQCVEMINGSKKSELKTATYELRKSEDNVFTRP